MKKYLFVIPLFFLQFSYAQENSIPEKKTQKTFVSADFLSVKMPLLNSGASEDNLGLTGIHFNIDFNRFYTGIGMYGAVSGVRGGFFTLGVNAGFKLPIYKGLFMDAGLHFGGGGGANTPDGGGAFLLPHANLGFKFNDFSITSGYSYINFFDGGAIRSHQLNVSLQIPLSISYAAISEAQKRFAIKSLKLSQHWNSEPHRTSVMLHLNQLAVIGTSKHSRGYSLDGTLIQLAGFELNSYFNKNTFFFAKFDGAYKGIKAGFMDILLGGGYHFSFNRNKTNILAKFGLGAGGGGGVDTKGGVLMYPDISLEQYIVRNVYLSINKGFLMSPNSDFTSSTWGVGLKYYLNINGVKGVDTTAKAMFKGGEIIVKQDGYLDVKRIKPIHPTENLYLISLQLNYHVNKNVYLAGQTTFANFGNAGAYAEGIVGMGLQTSYLLKEHLNFFVQGLAGGAGGGDVSTGEGIIVKPSVGINFKVYSGLALRGAVGYIKAKGGKLSSPSASLGITYRFSFLSTK